MKKNIMLFLILLVGVFALFGCESKPSESALAFKSEYESLNGKTNSKGAEHRTVTIPENNPYEKVTAKDILDKIDNKETFYVYFGDKLCPWCRSVIEKSIEVANTKKVSKIYYVNIWDDEGNEILRDKFELVDKKITKIIEGAEEYYKLLEVFKDFLNDYTIKNSKDETVSTGEKRIYAPNFMYVEDGVPQKLVEGISSLQSGARDELTEEILKEEETIFNNFFTNNKD